MIIVLCGLGWFGFSALMARSGFYNYCAMKYIADKDVDPELVYQMGKPFLLSTSWFACTVASTILFTVGLWLTKYGDAKTASQTVGVFLSLGGLGLLLIFQIVRLSQIWSDAVREIRAR
jgi:hypothetical protein